MEFYQYDGILETNRRGREESATTRTLRRMFEQAEKAGYNVTYGTKIARRGDEGKRVATTARALAGKMRLSLSIGATREGFLAFTVNGPIESDNSEPENSDN